MRAFAADPWAGTDRRRAQAILADLCADPQLAASDDLRRAFTAYVDAVVLGAEMERAVGDADLARRRAARVFVGNVSIGAHEQVVADPFVRAAIPGRWIVAIAATSHMGLRVPEGVLALDRDVPPPAYLGGAQFPPELQALDDPDAAGARGPLPAGPRLGPRQRRAGLGVVRRAHGLHLHAAPCLPARLVALRPAARHPGRPASLTRPGAPPRVCTGRRALRRGRSVA